VTLADELRRDVTVLAGEIGERNTRRPRQLAAAADFMAVSLAPHAVSHQDYSADGVACRNIVAELAGTSRPDEIVVVGGHYDSVTGCPGANDNGSGAAAVLALARAFAAKPAARTIRFVGFVNEEPPFFMTDLMGSLVYARRCAERKEKIVAMFSLETMGCFSDVKGSQKYPFPLGLLYPSTGDFIAFVSNRKSKPLLKRTKAAYSRSAKVRCITGALPESLTGVAWSDQWSFWQCGYPGVMVTDTAPFRYPHYHEPTDTPEKIDYARFTDVVEALEPVIREIATGT
jgi:Zn-dependent M28 family amino/carboxypeptidase